MSNSHLFCWWTRTYCDQQPDWLVTISVKTLHRLGGYPLQARAVMDDFGTLVITRGWM